MNHKALTLIEILVVLTIMSIIALSFITVFKTGLDSWNMAKAKRRHFIVKKDFQYRIFFETLIFMIFVAVLVGWTVYLGIFKVLIFELSAEKITLINRLISFRMLFWFLPTVFSIIIISVF